MKKFFLLAVFVFVGKLAGAQYSAMMYISAHKDAAIQIMKEHGIPASIVLGVAMHESANGNSTVAKKLHNHFGIKGRISRYFVRHKKVTTSYKKYDSALDSYEDFAGVLTGRKQFAHLGDKYDADDYVGWAKGIQKSGYAASRKWAAQVMNIIRKYNLDEYDASSAENKPEVHLATQNADEVPVLALAPPAEVSVAPVAPVEVTKVSSVHFYRVKKGDNLSVIAKKTGASVKNIRQKNNLKTTRLKPGQRLKL